MPQRGGRKPEAWARRDAKFEAKQAEKRKAEAEVEAKAAEDKRPRTENTTHTDATAPPKNKNLLPNWVTVRIYERLANEQNYYQ